MTLDETIRSACKISPLQLLEINLLSNPLHMIFVAYVDGIPKYLCKFAREVDGDARVVNEVRSLKRMADAMGSNRSVRVPNVVADITLHGRPALLTTFESGQNGRLNAGNRDVQSKVVEWLGELACRTASKSADANSAVTRLEHLIAERLPNETIPASDKLGSGRARLDRIPRVLTHGDLSYNNILVSDSTMVVIDWEDADPEGLPLMDVLDYLIYSSYAESGDYRIAAERVFDGTDRHASALLAGYCQFVGIPSEAIGILARATIFKIILKLKERDELRSHDSPLAKRKVAQLLDVVRNTDFASIKWSTP